MSLPLYAAGLNYTGLGSNTHVVNPEAGTHYRLFDKRFVEAFPECKLWRLTVSLARFLKASQGMGLDPVYVQQVRDALDGFHALGCQVILDAHDWLREWRVMEELDGFTVGRDRNDPEVYGKRYRISDRMIIDNKAFDDVELAAYGSKHKKDPRYTYIAHVHHIDKKLRISRWQVMGKTGAPKHYSKGGIVNTWQNIIKEFRDHPAIWGWELMNEPFTAAEPDPTTGQTLSVDNWWYEVLQDLVPAVQVADPNHFVLVDGNFYASASNWSRVSDMLKDLPDNGKLLYAAHYYVDANGGKWSNQQMTVLPDAGTRPCSNFFDWLKLNGKRGILTEFGHPPKNESAHIADKNLVEKANSLNIPVIQWAGGCGWGDTNPTAVNYDTPSGPVVCKDNINAIKPALSKRLESYDPVQ